MYFILIKRLQCPYNSYLLIPSSCYLWKSLLIQSVGIPFQLWLALIYTWNDGEGCHHFAGFITFCDLLFLCLNKMLVISVPLRLTWSNNTRVTTTNTKAVGSDINLLNFRSYKSKTTQEETNKVGDLNTSRFYHHLTDSVLNHAL